MIEHHHPYFPFIPSNSTKLIVGTIPPPRFSFGELYEEDVDFCYGSRDGLLWPILDTIFDWRLPFENTSHAVELRKKALIEQQIGICDIVESCIRNRKEASDAGMQQIKFRDMFSYLAEASKVRQLIFTGGGSKNGPEYLFKSYLKNKGLKLTLVSDKIPRKHYFTFQGRKLTTISLTAPSGSANRAIGGMSSYKNEKSRNPLYTTFDFRVDQYRDVFLSKC